MHNSVPKPLRVTLVQTSLVWHDPEANRQQLAEKLHAVSGQTDLIVLPEMFTSGFTTHPEVLEKNHTADWLLHQAQQLNAAVTGSVAWPLVESTPDQPGYVNRLLFATPEGELHHYDKVHLFSMGDEHTRYQPGNQRRVISYRDWRLLLTVCYDLRFPVFCRNRNDYDIMLNVANWPHTRRYHWRTLLMARAIENQAYVVGVNREGVDGKQLYYSGDSLAVNYLGELLLDKPDEWIQTVTFDYDGLANYRQSFPVWQDADEFALQL